MKNIEINIFVLLGLFLLIGIPVGLNFFLRFTPPCPVIDSPNSAPGVWLAFWGSYLSAIGAFAMAYISYTQNKWVQRQNEYYQKLTSKKEEYKDLERFVVKNENIHSYTYFLNIVNACNVSDERKARELIENYFKELETVTLESVKIKDNIDGNNRYLQALRAINEECYDMTVLISDILYYMRGEKDKIDKSEFVKYCECYIKESKHNYYDCFLFYVNDRMYSKRPSLYKELSDAGFDLLQLKREEILKMKYYKL